MRCRESFGVELVGSRVATGIVLVIRMRRECVTWPARYVLVDGISGHFSHMASATPRLAEVCLAGDHSRGGASGQLGKKGKGKRPVRF